MSKVYDEKAVNAFIRHSARVLPSIKLNVPFTAETINNIVGGPYTFKYIFYLKQLGFKFEYKREGRSIVEYTLVHEPKNVKTLRNSTWEPLRNVKKTPSVSVEELKKKNLETLKKVAALKKVNTKVKKEVYDDLETFNDNGTSFSVDNDWDSTEGLDLLKLL